MATVGIIGGSGLYQIDEINYRANIYGMRLGVEAIILVFTELKGHNI